MRNPQTDKQTALLGSWMSVPWDGRLAASASGMKEGTEDEDLEVEKGKVGAGDGTVNR